MPMPDVAAYIWPAYSGNDPRNRIFWPEGNGEWETVREAKALFEGHSWPRKPLWGYCNEADPRVMEMQIDAAADHGINVFIYDWYWYDNRPYLENCLNDGFLKAANRSRMKFYLMYANHDVTYGWDRRNSIYDYDTVVWQGKADRNQFRTIGERWLERYFCLNEYYKIDNKPVISIYDMQNFIDGLGGIGPAEEEMRRLDRRAAENGLNGIHWQIVKFGKVRANLSGFDSNFSELLTEDLVRLLPFDSVTHYQFAHFCNMNQSYVKIMERVRTEWSDIGKNFDIPYFPHISVGWDNTPRYRTHTENIVKDNTPEKIEAALCEAKELALLTGAPLVTINSWNEWTETSYLEPDDLYGYGYLEAVKRVFAR